MASHNRKAIARRDRRRKDYDAIPKVGKDQAKYDMHRPGSLKK